MPPERPGQGEARYTRYTFQVTDRDLFHIIRLHVSQSSSNYLISHKSIPFLTIIVKHKNLDGCSGVPAVWSNVDAKWRPQKRQINSAPYGRREAYHHAKRPSFGRIVAAVRPCARKLKRRVCHDPGSSCLVGRDTATASIELGAFS